MTPMGWLVTESSTNLRVWNSDTTSEKSVSSVTVVAVSVTVRSRVSLRMVASMRSTMVSPAESTSLTKMLRCTFSASVYSLKMARISKMEVMPTMKKRVTMILFFISCLKNAKVLCRGICR